MIRLSLIVIFIVRIIGGVDMSIYLMEPNTGAVDSLSGWREDYGMRVKDMSEDITDSEGVLIPFESWISGLIEVEKDQAGNWVKV